MPVGTPVPRRPAAPRRPPTTASRMAVRFRGRRTIGALPACCHRTDCVGHIKNQAVNRKIDSLIVPGPGIEPGWIAPPVFETGASTDSAIRAFGGAKVDSFFLFCKCFALNRQEHTLLLMDLKIFTYLFALVNMFEYICTSRLKSISRSYLTNA